MGIFGPSKKEKDPVVELPVSTLNPKLRTGFASESGIDVEGILIAANDRFKARKGLYRSRNPGVSDDKILKDIVKGIKSEHVCHAVNNGNYASPDHKIRNNQDWRPDLVSPKEGYPDIEVKTMYDVDGVESITFQFDSDTKIDDPPDDLVIAVVRGLGVEGYLDAKHVFANLKPTINKIEGKKAYYFKHHGWPC